MSEKTLILLLVLSAFLVFGPKPSGPYQGEISQNYGQQAKKDAEIQAKIDAENQERMDTESSTETPEGIDASVATDEKDVIDASVSTDTKDVIDASVSTDTKEVCDVFVETDAKENLQDFQQQTDVEDAKIKLKEFLNVMKDLSISDLTGVISRAAQAINDKSLL